MRYPYFILYGGFAHWFYADGSSRLFDLATGKLVYSETPAKRPASDEYPT